MEKELHREPATPEKIWATLDRITEKQEKAAQEMKEQRNEIDQRLKELAGLFTSQWGALMEKPGGRRPGAPVAGSRDNSTVHAYPHAGQA